MAYNPPSFMPYEPFLLGVGVVFNLLTKRIVGHLATCHCCAAHNDNDICGFGVSIVRIEGIVVASDCGHLGALLLERFLKPGAQPNLRPMPPPGGPDTTLPSIPFNTELRPYYPATGAPPGQPD